MITRYGLFLRRMQKQTGLDCSRLRWMGSIPANRAMVETRSQTLQRRSGWSIMCTRDSANRGRSLGVAALNKRQAEHIEQLLDQAIAADAALREYVDAWRDTPEYFFVKNLESVQGDERDVMLLSTVFGPTAAGKVAQNFGPINKPQGEKRMNVLITRAKQRLSIFTSLNPSDITNQSLGAQVWKRYLEFARTGWRRDSAVGAERDGCLEPMVSRAPLAGWFHGHITGRR